MCRAAVKSGRVALTLAAGAHHRVRPKCRAGRPQVARAILPSGFDSPCTGELLQVIQCETLRLAPNGRHPAIDGCLCIGTHCPWRVKIEKNAVAGIRADAKGAKSGVLQDWRPQCVCSGGVCGNKKGVMVDCDHAAREVTSQRAAY